MFNFFIDSSYCIELVRFLAFADLNQMLSQYAIYCKTKMPIHFDMDFRLLQICSSIPQFYCMAKKLSCLLAVNL